MNEEAKRTLAAALAALGVCTALSACGAIEGGDGVKAAKLKGAVEVLQKSTKPARGSVIGGLSSSAINTTQGQGTK